MANVGNVHPKTEQERTGNVYLHFWTGECLLSSCFLLYSAAAAVVIIPSFQINPFWLVNTWFNAVDTKMENNSDSEMQSEEFDPALI